MRSASPTRTGRSIWFYSSAQLPSASLAGRVLHTMVGAIDRASALELAVYMAALADILFWSRRKAPALRV